MGDVHLSRRILLSPERLRWGGGHKLVRDEDSNDDGLEMQFNCINVETLRIAPHWPLGYRFYC